MKKVKHMNNETRINTIKYFWERVPAGASIACGKGEKLLPVFRQLLDEFGLNYGIGRATENNRQVLTMGETEIKLVRARNVIDWLKKGNCFFALSSLDAICEWAAKVGYKKYEAFATDYEIKMLGTNRCTVEVACSRFSNETAEIVNAFKRNGIPGLDSVLRENNLRIASDIPNLAKYFFTSYLVDDSFDGSIELLPKYRYPVIVSVVESGNSLNENKWLRLSQIRKDAILLNSQTCIVTKRRQNVEPNQNL